MSCPRWNELARRRDEETGREAWRRAVSHLDECDGCRGEALRADPTLLFRRLPSPDVSPSDVDSMRERVALLRRARELERIESSSGEHGSSRWRWGARVASLLLVAGSLTAVDLRSPEGAPADPFASLATKGVPAEELPTQLRAQPVLEGADRPFDQVVEWTHSDLSLVVLVDDRLDV